MTLGTPQDRPLVNELLEGYGLPAVIAADLIDTLLVKSPEGGISAAVSLQTVGEDAFLFGLAVAPDRRGQGLGWVVGDAILRFARTLGVRTVYLATTVAADFFGSRLGFRPVEPSDITPAVREAPNFEASMALDNAVCMALSLE